MIDVLNRYHDYNNLNHTIHVMKYIFPRQFGLHNVFTSAVDLRETVQPLKDYTLREQEIARQQRLPHFKGPGAAGSLHAHLPKRLRGHPVALVQKLQKLHSRCSYAELLRHYCPLRVR
jgi:telomerase reverse transcriptase